jgi:hypothetical protein
VLVLAACGGSSGSPPPSSTGTTQPTSGAGATTAVRQAYATLFDLSNPSIDPKVAAVQNGAGLRSAIATELSTSLAKLAGGASVSQVTVATATKCGTEGLPSPCASVEYQILSTKGKPLLPSSSLGWAVYVSGRWVVAQETICGLLSLASAKAPAGC